MIEAISFLLPAFVACMLLASIHVYLGYHVITRGVIFVDLSLAQIAALGAMLAVARGHEPGSPWTYVFSLALALIGAGIFSLTGSRRHQERVPHEAIIGIVYAVAAACVILVASTLTHGAQEIERMLVGSILWVQWPTLLKTALLYAAIGAVHISLRRPFLEISDDPRAAHERGRHVRAIDFLFYATFALVITSSVAIAGVLLVFSFLVVPAVAGRLLADRLLPRLLIGWAVALLTSIAGLAASWTWDLPTGATIVAAFGAVLIVIAAGRSVIA